MIVRLRFVRFRRSWWVPDVGVFVLRVSHVCSRIVYVPIGRRMVLALSVTLILEVICHFFGDVVVFKRL